MSLWKIWPNTLVGFEVKVHDLAWDSDFLFDLEDDYAEEKEHRNVCLDLSGHFVLWKGVVDRFIYVNYYFEDKKTAFPTNRSEKTGYGLEAGFGGLWRPLDRISLLLRQGIAAEYNQTTLIDNRSERYLRSELIRMYNARLFVLFHLGRAGG